MVRRIRTAALALGCLFLLALPALAAPPAPPGPGAAAASIPFDLAALLKRTALADACNGGNCETGLGGVLSCPTSGGPTCQNNQPCACFCAHMPNGSWSSLNYCMDL